MGSTNPITFIAAIADSILGTEENEEQLVFRVTFGDEESPVIQRTNNKGSQRWKHCRRPQRRDSPLVSLMLRNFLDDN